MEIQIRRVRRTDFTAICQLAASADLPVPVPERATLRRFRRMVADLGSDLYIATERDRPVGFVHVSYSRDLLRGCNGHLMALLSESTRIVDSLLAVMRERAEQRSCRAISVVPGPWTSSLGDLTERNGWLVVDRALEVDLNNGPGTE